MGDPVAQNKKDDRSEGGPDSDSSDEIEHGIIPFL